MQVIWRYLFTTSSRDHGTLGQLCSILSRLPKAKKPKKDYNACIDALFTIVKGHVIAAACLVMEIKVPDVEPSSLAAIKMASPAAKQSCIFNIAEQVLSRCAPLEEVILCRETSDTGDGVNNYARLLCYYEFLAMEFEDAWKEGDGERVTRCWQIFLLHFHKSGNTKYALQALRLQFQLASLSPQAAHQVMWNRFVNTHGGSGRNRLCDLHNEHINKLLKKIVTNMGSNLTEKALHQSARCVSTLQQVAQTFEQQSDVPVRTSAHCTLSARTDVQKVTSVVMENELLQSKPGRQVL